MKETFRKYHISVLWLMLISLTFAVRYYFVQFLPTYLWSKDSSSYLDTSFQWIHTGLWQIDIRRGPIYSFFAGLILKAIPNLSAVMIVQHVLGALSILVAVALLCRLYSKNKHWLILICGFAYALYELPLYLEHLIRNETLLLFFGTIALSAWALALNSNYSIFWLSISGLTLALFNLTKNLFLPMPFLVLGIIFYQKIKYQTPFWKPVAFFLSALLIPYLFVNFQNRSNLSQTEQSSYAGVQLYGRVAQWTYLEGGKYLDIKELIREPVKKYQTFKKLDNNVVIKKLIVPVIETHLKQQGLGFSEVNRVCRDLAFEAITKHPQLFAKQVLADLYKIHFQSGYRVRLLKTNDLRDLIDDMQQIPNPDPLMHHTEVVTTLQKITNNETFLPYYRWVKCAWLFEFLPPVFLTTALLPFLFWIEPTPRKYFWLTLGGLWYFNIFLLATVGRPLNRYFVPLAPIMFWTLTGTLLWVFGKIRRSNNLTQT